MAFFSTAAVLWENMKHWCAIKVGKNFEFKFEFASAGEIFLKNVNALNKVIFHSLSVAHTSDFLFFPIHLRCPLDSAVGQYWARVDWGYRWGPHPSTFIPVPPVCRQRRGPRPVQQRDWPVSAVLHPQNIWNISSGLWVRMFEQRCRLSQLWNKPSFFHILKLQ